MLGVTVAEAKSRLSANEWRAWREWLAREPDTGERLDWWLSRILATMLNQNRRPGTSPIRAESLCPDRWATGEPDTSGRSGMLSGQALGAAFKAWAKGVSRKG